GPAGTKHLGPPICKRKNQEFIAGVSMKNRFVFPLVLLLCSGILPVRGWSQNLTQIADTLFNADGTKASGRIVISWEPFTASSGETIDGGTKTYTIPASGL